MRRAVLLALGLILALALAVIARAEIVQHGRFRVKVDASLSPERLPRKGLAPVRFALSARFIATQGSVPPQLTRIKVEINRHGHLDPTGLPICPIDEIQPATTTNALTACRPSLVGEGHFSAKVLFTQQSPFPSDGKLVAFNGVIGCKPSERALRFGRPLAKRTRNLRDGRALSKTSIWAGRLWPSSSRMHGGGQGERTPVRDPRPPDRRHRDAPCHRRPAILAHIYGPKPVPTSYTIPFVIKSVGKGTYGTELSASLPRFSGRWGYVTGISLTLARSFSSRGQRHSYLSAGCPAPDGIPIVSFPLTRASFGFGGHQAVTSGLSRTCRPGR